MSSQVQSGSEPDKKQEAAAAHVARIQGIISRLEGHGVLSAEALQSIAGYIRHVVAFCYDADYASGDVPREDDADYARLMDWFLYQYVISLECLEWLASEYAPAARARASLSIIADYPLRRPWPIFKALNDVEEDTPKLGDSLGDGRYVLKEKLGQGGQGEVYRAVDTKHNANVAIKVLTSQWRSEVHWNRFANEASQHMRFAHAHIRQIIDHGVGKGAPYLVMQYIEGENFATYLKRQIGECAKKARSTPPKELIDASLRIVRDIAQAVDYVRQQGVVHRDIKPGNILINKNGVAYLADFGIAKLEASSANLTKAGEALGTLEYTSPEQIMDPVTAGSSTDIWALGVILYEAVTFAKPFAAPFSMEARGEAAYRRELSAAIISGDLKDARKRNPAVAKDLWTVIYRALQKSVSERYPKAAMLAADLQAILDGKRVSARMPTKTEQVCKWVGRNKAFAWGITGGCLALVGVSVLLHLTLSYAEELEQAQLASGAAALSGLREMANAELEDILSPMLLTSADHWLREAETVTEGLRALLTGRDHLTPAQRRLQASFNQFLADENYRGGFADVRSRMKQHEAIRDNTLEPGIWAQAIRDIAESPLYAGRVYPKPTIGLLPIGFNRQGYYEFALLAPSDRTVPERATTESNCDRQISESSAIIFVLLPGAKARIGADLRARSAVEEKANVDTGANENERPSVEVELKAFLIAKTELSQASWKAMAGENPSAYRRDTPEIGPKAEKPTTDLHPVESISHVQCRSLLRRYSMDLPTEAQWEYAARGGTGTPWWGGETPDCLRAERMDIAADETYAVANIADVSLMRKGSATKAWEQVPGLNDGYALHAPVSEYSPNPFGLHGIHGNVMEWCRDSFLRYDEGGFGAGDGERIEATRFVVVRDGSFYRGAEQCRVTVREGCNPNMIASDVGVRPVFEVRGWAITE